MLISMEVVGISLHACINAYKVIVSTILDKSLLNIIDDHEMFPQAICTSYISVLIRVL